MNGSKLNKIKTLLGLDDNATGAQTFAAQQQASTAVGNSQVITVNPNLDSNSRQTIVATNQGVTRASQVLKVVLDNSADATNSMFILGDPSNLFAGVSVRFDGQTYTTKSVGITGTQGTSTVKYFNEQLSRKGALISKIEMTAKNKEYTNYEQFGVNSYEGEFEPSAQQFYIKLWDYAALNQTLTNNTPVRAQFIEDNTLLFDDRTYIFPVNAGDVVTLYFHIVLQGGAFIGATTN